MNERMNEIVNEAVGKGHKNLKSIPIGFGLDGQMDGGTERWSESLRYRKGTISPKDCIY